MGKKYIYLLVLAVYFIGLTSCNNEFLYTKPEDTVITRTETQESLKDSPFPFGLAVGVNYLKSDEHYKEIVRSEVTRISTENAMKMNVISKGRGIYNWTDPDYIVDFAQNNDLKIHGHTLLWYRQTPQWVANFKGDREDWIEIMKEYIFDVVGRYKGKVSSWDVINEVINDNGEVYEKNGSYENLWMKNIGIEYIDLAFRFAHEADPDALLFYNEYGYEYSQPRRKGVNKLINTLKKRGVPIHGIGLQMHTNINHPISDLRNSIIMLADSTKLQVHISELDIALNPKHDPNLKLNDELLKRQQVHYCEIVKAMIRIPKEQQFGITCWGVIDSSSYMALNPDWPLLFDNNYQKKPAYKGVLEGFE